MEIVQEQSDRIVGNSYRNRRRIPHANLESPQCERFAGPVDTTTLETAAKGIIPPKTEQSTQWVVSNFESWSVSRASHSSSAAVPPNILCTNDAELVCKWLCCYVLETRNKDGSRYPPSTIRSLVSGLN